MTYESVEYEVNRTLIETNIEKIKKEIEESRQELYNLINITEDFGNKNVIIQSQKLDELLNDYEQIKFGEKIRSI